MKLEQEKYDPISNPTWNDVETALNSIDPKENSFFILANKNGSYVQTAGARLRVIVEYRKKSLFGFKHVVLGKPSKKTERTSINYSGGIIALDRNEILTIKDAIEIFEEFYNSNEIPVSYVTRDITEEQKEGKA